MRITGVSSCLTFCHGKACADSQNVQVPRELVRIASVSSGESLCSRPGRMSRSSSCRLKDQGSALLPPVGGAVLDFNVLMHVVVLFRIYPPWNNKRIGCGYFGIRHIGTLVRIASGALSRAGLEWGVETRMSRCLRDHVRTCALVSSFDMT